jgi:hypothetical protein
MGKAKRAHHPEFDDMRSVPIIQNLMDMRSVPIIQNLMICTVRDFGG